MYLYGIGFRAGLRFVIWIMGEKMEATIKGLGFVGGFQKVNESS